MKKLWLVLLTLTTISCSVHKGKIAEDRHIFRVREGGVNLYLYAPYAKNTRVVILDTLSTLRLETDLPLSIQKMFQNVSESNKPYSIVCFHLAKEKSIIFCLMFRQLP